MIINRDAAIRVVTELLARLPGLAEPLSLDGPSPLAVAIIGALYPDGPQPGDTLTCTELHDLPPGSLIRSRFDGHVLERTQHGWRFCWDPVSLSPEFRDYELLLRRDDRAAPLTVGGLAIGDKITLTGEVVGRAYEVEVIGFQPNGVINVKRVSSNG